MSRMAGFILLIMACAAKLPEPQKPRGLQLENVQLTTWRGAAVSARGSAKRAMVSGKTFTAEDVVLTTATGARLTTARADGDLSLDPASSHGLKVTTADGCSASTEGGVFYHLGVAATEGAVEAKGCGLRASGSKLTYFAIERRAELEGPVKTRIEAAP